MTYPREPPLHRSQRVPHLHSELISYGNGSDKEHGFKFVAAHILFREFLQSGIRHAMDG